MRSRSASTLRHRTSIPPLESPSHCCLKHPRSSSIVHHDEPSSPNLTARVLIRGLVLRPPMTTPIVLKSFPLAARFAGGWQMFRTLPFPQASLRILLPPPPPFPRCHH